MRDPRKLIGKAGLVAAAAVPGGIVGAAAAGAALFGRSRGPQEAPARPDVNAPFVSGEQIARAQKEDARWSSILAAEFEVLPIPSLEERIRNYPRHDATNLQYVRAPGPPAGHHADNAFFQELMRRQWTQGVRPANRAQTGHMGGHRPMMLDGNNRMVPMPGTGAERPLHGNAAQDWGAMREIERVNAYTFRGDTRDPSQIKAAGGFSPPSTRTDASYTKLIATRFCDYMEKRYGKTVDPTEVTRYISGQGQRGERFVEYEIWRAILDSEKMHIGRMAADEFLKGYVSTTRDPRRSTKFAADRAEQQGLINSWLYAVHTEGGFLLPGNHSANVHRGIAVESEIAHPGVLDWNHVVGAARYAFVDMDDASTYSRQAYVVYIRHGLRNNRAAFDAIYAALSTEVRPDADSVRGGT